MHMGRSERGPDTGIAPAGSLEIPESTITLEDLEKVHIERVLKMFNYSRTRTADALGISKKTLYLKIKRYGMIVAG